MTTTSIDFVVNFWNMLLSRPEILRHKKEGNVVITPFDKRKLNTASYDLTLGEWFYSEGHPEGRATVHNLYDEKSRDVVWTGPHKAETAKKMKERLNIASLENIPDNSKVIMLAPGETILAHTEEYIGGQNNCIAKMYARSSTGRNFIEVCKDAGWGDVGYINRWTMEVTNNSQHFTIPLVVGRRIAQMVFYEIEPLESKEEHYAKESGKYQASADLKVLKKNWKPQDMLPRMHMDWEVREDRKKGLI